MKRVPCGPCPNPTARASRSLKRSSAPARRGSAPTRTGSLPKSPLRRRKGSPATWSKPLTVTNGSRRTGGRTVTSALTSRPTAEKVSCCVQPTPRRLLWVSRTTPSIRPPLRRSRRGPCTSRPVPIMNGGRPPPLSPTTSNGTRRVPCGSPATSRSPSSAWAWRTPLPRRSLTSEPRGSSQTTGRPPRPLLTTRTTATRAVCGRRAATAPPPPLLTKLPTARRGSRRTSPSTRTRRLAVRTGTCSSSPTRRPLCAATGL